MNSSEPNELRVPIVEEEIAVGIREVATGTVQVRTSVDQDDLVLSRDLLRSKVAIDRVPINRRVEQLPQERIEGSVRVIPVFEERVVVTKELWLVEELHIRRNEVTERVDVPVSRRMTRVDVSRHDTQQED